MQQWEYAQVLYGMLAAERRARAVFSHQERGPDVANVWDLLREMGDAGWELVSAPMPLATYDGGPGASAVGYALWFKRPRS